MESPRVPGEVCVNCRRFNKVLGMNSPHFFSETPTRISLEDALARCPREVSLKEFRSSRNHDRGTFSTLVTPTGSSANARNAPFRFFLFKNVALCLSGSCRSP